MSATFRVNLSVSDPDEAHEWLGRSYVEHKARFARGNGQFRVRHASAQFDGFSVGLLDHRSPPARLDTSPTGDWVMVAQLLAGEYEVTTSKDRITVSPGDVFLVDPDAAVTINQSDIRLSLLRIERDALQRAAVELTGGEITELVRFPLSRPLSAARGRRWQNLVHSMLQDMPTEDGLAVPAARHRSLRLITGSLLRTFPNSALPADPRSAREPADRILRRAMSFIADMADRAIDVPDIAEAARVTALELTVAFQAHLRTTPAAYLDRVRLEYAHRELNRGGLAEYGSIAELARRWGFAHAGQFVNAYRSRFGEMPTGVQGLVSRHM